MTVQLAPALAESDLTAAGAWWAGPIDPPAPSNGDAYLDLANGLMSALTPCLAAGRAREIRAALVKAIAATTSTSVFHGSDNDVLKLSLDLREEIYHEVMTFRRAVLRDVGQGALDA